MNPLDHAAGNLEPPFCNKLFQFAEDFDFDGIQKFMLEFDT